MATKSPSDLQAGQAGSAGEPPVPARVLASAPTGRDPSRRTKRSRGLDALAEWRGYRDPLPPASRQSHIRDLLGQTLKGLGLDERVREEVILAGWKEIAGEFIALHSRPDKIRERVLTVLVLQPTLRFELERQKAQLLANLRLRFGASVIANVRFLLG